MKAPLTFKDRYPITTLIVSAVVAVLIHFPEVLSLSDSFERQELFAGMEPQDVINEILFTFISLLLLFWINMRIFRFNTPMVRVTKTKMALSFFLTWAAKQPLRTVVRTAAPPVRHSGHRRHGSPLPAPAARHS